MNRKWMQFLTSSLVFCLGSTSWAADLSWTGGDGNWDNPASWGGAVPTSSDLVVLRDGGTITVDSPGRTAGRLNAFSGTVEVKTGGVLELTADADLGAAFVLKGGNLLVSGGEVIANALANDFIDEGSTLTITAGSFSHAEGFTRLGDNGPGTLTVKGTGSYTGGILRFVSDGTVNLEGPSASLSGLKSIVADGGVNNYRLTLGDRGIKAIEMTGNLDIEGTATLSVDLLAYDAAHGREMDLFTFGSATENWDDVLINGTSIGSISIAKPSTTPFTAGSWQGDFVVTANGIRLENLSKTAGSP